MTATSQLPEKTKDINPADLPEVKVLTPDASLREVVEALTQAGGVIIKGLHSPETMKQVEKEIRETLNQDAPWDGDFFPMETRRCMALVSRSPTGAECIMGCDLFWDLSRAFLEKIGWYWYGDKKQYCRSSPQLNTSIGFSIAPGAADQALHRDDHCHHNEMEEIDTYPTEINSRETLVGYFFAVKKTTKENGATRFIPGSHLWGKDREPSDHLAFYAEMDPGDAFFMLGSCYHGGSANKTADEERLVVGSFTCKGYLRQEENQYLACDQEVISKWPTLWQKRLGYSLSEPFLGWVDATDPIKVINPKEAAKNQNMFSDVPVEPFSF